MFTSSPLPVHGSIVLMLELLFCRVYELRYFNIADNEGEDEE